MDKQKDFEKGWEEYKAKKKQQIEELEKTLYNYRFSYDDCIAGSETDLAKFLVNRGWIKPAENAVVLTREEFEVYEFVKKKHASNEEVRSSEIVQGILHHIKTVRKETAEKFAERLKEMAYQSTDWSHGEHPMVVEVDYIDEICEEITEGKV
jgi:hypothetical protein